MKLAERILAAQDRNPAGTVTTVQPFRPPSTRPAGRDDRPKTEGRTLQTAKPVVLAEPASAQPVDVFAAMKLRAATALFEKMGARFNDASVTEQELRSTAKDELSRIIDAEQVPLTAEERTRLVADVADDVLGYGPLQRLLDDPAVTEIMVNRMDQIYVERKGK
ncbi:MAG: Flp pilus assembly protein ATPase CpaF, partial [Pseudarthrobacter sp.]|nr:Flp pilus assembly protein ATPase CpaF [Pseudarthrobacter sp.]